MSTAEKQKLPPVISPEQAAQILGVALTSDPQVIHQAYRVAAKRAHPDVGGSAAQFAHIRSAYELLLWQRSQQAQPVQVQVRAGAVVWARSRFQPWPVVVAMVAGSVLLGTAAMWGSASAFHVALGLAIVLLVRALYIAAGRPPLSAQWWRQQWKKRRNLRDPGEWDTQPIPVMTDERIRQYEQTGR